MTDLNNTLTTLVGQAFRESPKLAEIRARYKNGELTQELALQEMLEELGKNPDLLAVIEQMRPSGEKVRLNRINPLIEAALIERAQFDGDMPELRTGPLLPGTKAAVPIVLTGTNPVAGGLMLQAASEQMTQMVEAHEARRHTQIQHYLTEALPEMKAVGTDLATKSDPEITALVKGSADTDLPEYRRGQVPAPLAPATPTGATLAALTPEQSREAAWKLLSTTQGRRSAQPVVALVMAEELRKKGYTVTLREVTRATNHLAFHEWSVRMSGPGSTQASFSFIDMAARVLAAGLRSKLGDTKDVIIEVDTIDRIADRVVGWRAAAYTPDAPLTRDEAMIIFETGDQKTTRPAPKDDESETRKVWTFIILGGEYFSLCMPQNPRLTHAGGLGARTVWKMFGREHEVREIEDLIRPCGADVTVYGETQTTEMSLERMATTGQPGPK